MASGLVGLKRYRRGFVRYYAKKAAFARTYLPYLQQPLYVIYVSFGVFVNKNGERRREGRDLKKERKGNVEYK